MLRHALASLAAGQRRNRGSGIGGQVLPRPIAPLAKITVTSMTDGTIGVFIDDNDCLPGPIDAVGDLDTLPAPHQVAVLLTQLCERAMEEEGVKR